MTAPVIYRQDLFGDPVRLETDSGRPRCRHSVPQRDGATGFDQCKRAGEFIVDGFRLCRVHNPTAVQERQRAKAAKAAAAERQDQLRFASKRMLRALIEIRDGCADPAGRAAKAIGNLDR